MTAMRIMLSPERASVLRRDGRVAFAVEGEPCRGSATSCPPMTRAMCCYGGNHHPPAEWVALDGDCTVVKAVEPCPKKRCAGVCCHSCRGNGTVIVDAVTVQVLPVIANSNDWDHGTTNHVDLMGTTCIMRTNTEGFSQDADILDLDPLPRPGVDWVVVLTMLSDLNPEARS